MASKMVLKGLGIGNQATANFKKFKQRRKKDPIWDAKNSHRTYLEKYGVKRGGSSGKG